MCLWILTLAILMIVSYRESHVSCWTGVPYKHAPKPQWRPALRLRTFLPSRNRKPSYDRNPYYEAPKHHEYRPPLVSKKQTTYQAPKHHEYRPPIVSKEQSNYQAPKHHEYRPPVPEKQTTYEALEPYTKVLTNFEAENEKSTESRREPEPFNIDATKSDTENEETPGLLRSTSEDKWMFSWHNKKTTESEVPLLRTSSPEHEDTPDDNLEADTIQPVSDESTPAENIGTRDSIGSTRLNNIFEWKLDVEQRAIPN